jgi:hypothetical protein
MNDSKIKRRFAPYGDSLWVGPAGQKRLSQRIGSANCKMAALLLDKLIFFYIVTSWTFAGPLQWNITDRSCATVLFYLTEPSHYRRQLLPEHCNHISLVNKVVVWLLQNFLSQIPFLHQTSSSLTTVYNCPMTFFITNFNFKKKKSCGS